MKIAKRNLWLGSSLGLLCWATAVACGDGRAESLLDPGEQPGTGGDSGGGIHLGMGGDGSLGVAGDDGTAGESCVPTLLDAGSPVVNVLLVVDKSGSMDDTPDGFATDKWTALKTALGAAFGSTQAKLSYGLDLYPYSGESGGDLTMDCQMPAGAAVAVPVQAGSRAAPLILAALDDNPPSGGTPTAAALHRALLYYTEGAGKGLGGEKYVLLATDGGPNCNAALTCAATSCTVNLDGLCPPKTNCCDAKLDPDGPGKCLDEDASVSEVKALADAGIKTFVVGIPGTEAYTDTLDLLAAESGVTNPDAPPGYFAVSAAGGVEALSSVLERITTGLITSCRLQLDHDPPRNEPMYVWADGVLLEQDGEDGWELDTSTTPDTVVLKGETCATVETEGISNVRITYHCPEPPH